MEKIETVKLKSHICFLITPTPKPRMTRRDGWLNPPRKCVARYRAFADAIKIQANKTEFKLPARFNIIFFIPMPESWSVKIRNKMAGQPHQQRPDIDNLLKAFMDALVDDDSFVHEVTMRKQWSYSSVGYIIIEHMD